MTPPLLQARVAGWRHAASAGSAPVTAATGEVGGRPLARRRPAG